MRMENNTGGRKTLGKLRERRYKMIGRFQWAVEWKAVLPEVQISP